MKNYKLLGLITFFALFLTSKNTKKTVPFISGYDIHALAHQAYTEDSNTVRFRTDDIALIADSAIKFKIYVKGVVEGEPVDIVISNPDVIQNQSGETKSLYKSQTGSTFIVHPHNYGRTAVTVIPKKSPKLRQSFAIYIEDLATNMADSVLNASIKPFMGRNFLDPLHNTLPTNGSNPFLLTRQLFTAEGIHQGSEYAQLQWEVITKGEVQHPTRVSLNKKRDSATIYFSKGGNYTIYLKHKNNQAKTIIDSMDFSVNLPPAYSSSLVTGELPYIIDNKDGQKYKLLTFPDPERSGYRVVFTEYMRYLPYVAKLGATGVGVPITPHILVFGNNTTENAELVRPNLTSQSMVVYNSHAALGLPVGKTLENTDVYNSTKNIQGICPDGFFIPNDDYFPRYLSKNFRPVEGYRSPEIKAHFSKGIQTGYNGDAIMVDGQPLEMNAVPNRLSKPGRASLYIHNQNPLRLHNVKQTRDLAEAGSQSIDYIYAYSVICAFSEWYHRGE